VNSFASYCELVIRFFLKVVNLLKMTTAARPTFDPARGGSGARERDLSAMSKQYSSRDLPSHTSLKSRERGQNDPEELKTRDFRRELEERERAAARERESGPSKRESSSGGGSSVAIGSSSLAKKSRLEPANLDADDPIDDSDDGKRLKSLLQDLIGVLIPLPALIYSDLMQS